MTDASQQQDGGIDWSRVMQVAAEEKVPTYLGLLQDAECLKTKDLEVVDKIVAGCVRAKLDDVRVGLIIDALTKDTGFSKTDLRAKFKAQKKTNNAKVEDIGQKIVRLALDEFYCRGAHLTRSVTGHFWEYVLTHWVRRTEEQVEAKLLMVIRKHVSPEAGSHSAALYSAMQLLRADRSQDVDVFRFAGEPHPVINCRNCELWIMADGTPQPRKHSPESYLTYCLPFDYDPTAECPLYDQTLHEIFANSGDTAGMTRHWNEFFGYAVQPIRDIPSWWMLKGHGANGKSKLVETISRMLGPDAVASVRVESLSTQFGRSPLLGKLIMVDDDVDAGTKLPDGVLKQISERKRVSVEFKGQTPFDAVLTVLPIMLCNNFPVTSDVTHGMQRRAYVIPFDRQFDGAEQDRTLFPRIWDLEMSGVLNRALDGLRRLRERGGFLLPAACSRAAQLWLAEANPLNAFIDECMVQIPPGSARKALRLSQIYEVFVRWAEMSGVRHITARKRMKANLESMGLQVSGSGGYVTVPSLAFGELGKEIAYTQLRMVEPDDKKPVMDYSKAPLQ